MSFTIQGGRAGWGKATIGVVGSVVLSVVACGSDASSGSSSGTTSSGAAASGGATASGGVAGPGASTGGCQIFPSDNPWNTDISASAVDTDAMTKLFPQMNGSKGLHPDWGTFGDEYGIPITVGKAGTPVKIDFDNDYGAKESDKLACPSPGSGDFCYPIPLDAKIEGGTGADSGEDRHVLFLDTTNAPAHCVLYELYNAQNPGSGSGGSWTAGAAAIWHLDSNALRTEGWTSADAAGLPILPGLVRKEEIDKGEIPHALRFTMDHTQNGFIHPATHAAGKADASDPPMGLRVRLKASFDDSSFSGPVKTIITAMKKYGLILADNGSDWFISGETSDAWDMDAIVSPMGKIKGSDFEIVKTGAIIPQPD